MICAYCGGYFDDRGGGQSHFCSTVCEASYVIAERLTLAPDYAGELSDRLFRGEEFDLERRDASSRKARK